MALELSHMREHSCRSLRNLSWYALSKEFGSNSYILSLYARLCNRSLFVRRPTNERRPKKVTFTKTVFSINSTTHKMSIKNPTRSSEEEAEYQIPNLSVYLRYLNIR
jgi:hypothetical protein